MKTQEKTQSIINNQGSPSLCVSWHETQPLWAKNHSKKPNVRWGHLAPPGASCIPGKVLRVSWPRAHFESQMSHRAGDAAPVLQMTKWEGSWILHTCLSPMMRKCLPASGSSSVGWASFLFPLLKQLLVAGDHWEQTHVYNKYHTRLPLTPSPWTACFILRIISSSLWRFTLYALKFTHVVIQSHTHQHSQVSEPLYHLHATSPMTAPVSDNWQSTSVSMVLPFLETSCKWNHIVFRVWLLSLSLSFLGFNHFVISSLKKNCSVLLHCMNKITFCLFTHQWRDTGLFLVLTVTSNTAGISGYQALYGPPLSSLSG